MEVVYNPSSIPVMDSVKIQLGISPNQKQSSSWNMLLNDTSSNSNYMATYTMYAYKVITFPSKHGTCHLLRLMVFLHSCSALLAQVYWLQPRHPQRQKIPNVLKCVDCPIVFWVMDLKCAMLALILHVAHASETACETCATSLLQTVHSHNDIAHESLSQNVKSSCLSFIHIPKTGGGSIEFARIKAAGTEWNPRLSPDDRDGKCFEKVRHDRLSRFKGDHSHPNASFRFWGACDDQIQCSSDNATSTHCHFTTRAGALGRCSRWHVPPGLDVTVAASYARNPFDKIVHM